MTPTGRGVRGRRSRPPARIDLLGLTLFGLLLPATAAAGRVPAIDPSWAGQAPACAMAKATWAARGDDHRDDDPRYAAFDVLHVELTLELKPDSARINGSAVYHLMATRFGCPLLLLDLVDSLEVTSCRRLGREVAFEHRNRLLLIPLSPPLEPGELTQVTIDYRGRPPRDGPLGLAFELQGDPDHGFPLRPLISTLSETHSAAAWWPCKNITHDKFTIDALYVVPDSLTAVGNGLLQEVRDLPGRRRGYHWRESYPIATYLVSLAATDYVSWSDEYVDPETAHRTPILYYAFRHDEAKARQAWARTPEMLSAFVARFGEYPFPREKYAMAEFNWPGAMENQTCTSMGGYYLLYDVPSNERVVAHELAHQWWGDQVSPARWDDIWLNEGFAVYGEAIWQEHLGGRAAYLAHMRDVERDEYPGPIVPPLYAFNTTVYLKGAWVVHMLRGVLGDELFFRALQDYRRDYTHGCATTDGFRQILEQDSGRSLESFFDSWVYGTGRPIYTVTWTWTAADSGGVVDLDVRQDQAEGVFAMPIPIVFPYADGRADTIRIDNALREQHYRLELSQEPEDLQFDPEGWILKKVRTIIGPTGVRPEDDADAGARGRSWALRVVPNPSSGPVRILLQSGSPAPLSAGGRAAPVSSVELRIVDVAGRVIGRLPALWSESGAYTAEWDVRRTEGMPATSGTFWVTAPEEPGPPAARFILTR